VYNLILPNELSFVHLAIVGKHYADYRFFLIYSYMLNIDIDVNKYIFLFLYAIHSMFSLFCKRHRRLVWLW